MGRQEHQGGGPSLVTPPAELTTTSQSTSTSTITGTNSLSGAGLTVTVPAARRFSIGVLVLAVGAMVAMGGVLIWQLMTDEHARIRARYGSRMVDVETPRSGQPEAPAALAAPHDLSRFGNRFAAQRGSDANIRVASMHDLSRLAERFGSFILHEPTLAGHRYFVRDGDDTYEYATTSSESPPGQQDATGVRRV